MKTVRVVAAVIKAENGKGQPIIFATQRGYGDLKGGWEFPGGKLEPGESDEQALVRELKEELGLDVFDVKFFMHVEYEYETFILKMNTYKCKTDNEIAGLFVHKKAGFFDRTQLAKLDFLPADKPIINRLIAEWN